MKIRICGVDEVGIHAKWATHIISLCAPSSRGDVDALLRGARAELLRLDFADVAGPRESGAPRAADVGEILRFGKDVPGDGKLLVHCMAGISRSTAGAWAILCARHPTRSADELFWEMLDLRPIARPNILMTQLADAALRRKGEMIESLRIWYEVNGFPSERGFG